MYLLIENTFNFFFAICYMSSNRKTQRDTLYKEKYLLIHGYPRMYSTMMVASLSPPYYQVLTPSVVWYEEELSILTSNTCKLNFFYKYKLQ